tara:strand:- start:1323 stop:1574 length:252 start_codon:yes stop_codon:yes gene_type:complete
MDCCGYIIYPNGQILGKYGKMLKHWITDTGYHSVNIYIGKNRKYIGVHRLVAICYLSNPNNKTTVNHIDNDPHNNDLTNLEWK